MLGQELSLHFLDDAAVLFDARRQSIYGLNAIAAFTLCCLDDGMSRDDIAMAAARTFALPPDVAGDYVSKTLRDWRRLAARRREQGRPRSASASAPQQCQARDEAGGKKAGGVAPLPGARSRIYRMLDANVTIRYATRRLHDATHPFLAHLEADASDESAVFLDVVTEGRDTVFAVDGREMDRCAGLDHVTAYAKFCLLTLALRGSADVLAIHAAAVSAGGNGVLLPGRSQSGKSTLSAALAANGFRYLGDDTIVLSAGTLDARPVPFGVSVKEGAWTLLAPRFPQLPELPVMVRGDGKRVRYLCPPALPNAAHPELRVPVRWIVLPEYAPDSRDELVPLERPAALGAMLRGVTPLGDGLDRDKVDGLVRWIAGIECYTLRMSSLDGAVALISDLCR